MQQPKVPIVKEVDINQFMGDRYVIAHIPAFVGKNVYNGGMIYAQ